MSLWKIVAGAAAGVGALAALPVFGAVGTITAAGAAVGALVGALGGAVASEMEESDREAARAAGVSEGKAEYKVKFDALVQRVEALKQAGAQQRDFERRVAALFAVGFAVAAADGPVSDEERAIIRDFVGGASVEWHTESLRSTVEELAANPPDFGAAMLRVDELDDPRLDEIIDEMIELAIIVDGGESPGETAFREAWRRHRAARQARSA